MKDVGVLADCERIVQESVDGLGGLDIIVANAVRDHPPGWFNALSSGTH